MLHRRTPVGAWHAVPLRRRQLVSDALVAYLNNGYVCCCVIPAHNCYTLPTYRVALGWATSAPRVGTPWRRLPACVEASSPPPSSAGRWLVYRHESGATTRLRAGIAFTPDRLDGRHEHIQHPRDQDGERRTTRRIVCTAGAAAWLPQSKPCDTHMMRT